MPYPEYTKAPPKFVYNVFENGVMSGPDANKLVELALDDVIHSNLKNLDGTYDGILGSKFRLAVAEAIHQNKLRAVNNHFLDLKLAYEKTLGSLWAANKNGWTQRNKLQHERIE